MRVFPQNTDRPPAFFRYIADVTAAGFRAWLKAMNISGAEAARLLGVSPDTITRYKAKGGPKLLALACAALWHRQEPLA